MAMRQGMVAGNYRRNDGWNMATFGMNQASSYLAVTPVVEPIGSVGGWRGSSKKMSFIYLDQRRSGSEYEELFHPLIKCANQSETISTSDLFTVYVNMIRLICPAKDHEIRSIFENKGFEIIDLNEIETKIWYHSLGLTIRKLLEESIMDLGLTEDVRDVLRQAQESNNKALEEEDPEEADDEVEIPSDILGSVLGIYFNLITKKITTLNLDNWYKGRVRAYARNAMSDVDDTWYGKMKPSVKFSEAVNSGMAACFSFKREVSFIVREISTKEDHPLNEHCKITMGYFKMAELTSFGMVVEYILTQNPVLLAWNGVNKYLPYFKSALDKYRSLGNDGPYCKLIYPPELLSEFKGERIGVLTNIAHDIATYEGRSTLSNLKGTNLYPLPPSMVATVRRIITLYSGAITKSVAHCRVEGFAVLNCQSALAEALNSPPREDDNQDDKEEDPDVIPGVAPSSIEGDY